MKINEAVKCVQCQTVVNAMEKNKTGKRLKKEWSEKPFFGVGGGGGGET